MFSETSASSLNSYGYSPHSLKSYASWIYALLSSDTATGLQRKKPIIISITASKPDVLDEMLLEIQGLRRSLQEFHAASELRPGASIDASTLVAIELNTSCPNIKDAPPPAYDFASLAPILGVLAAVYDNDRTLTIGLKLPPYIYSSQFENVVQCLSVYSRPNPAGPTGDTTNPFAFVTCTNTLGSCLFFADQTHRIEPKRESAPSLALPTALGGLGGDALHALALGNVHTFAQLFARHPDSAIRKIKIIGVGGVTSQAARRRMIQAGASAVGCATLLGQHGIKAFDLLRFDPEA